MSARQATQKRRQEYLSEQPSSGLRSSTKSARAAWLEDEQSVQRRSAERRGVRRGSRGARRKLSKEQSEWLFAGVVFVGILVAVVVGIHIIGGTTTAFTPPSNSAFSGTPGSGPGGGFNATIVSAVANALGMSSSTLSADLQAGDTVSQLAAQQHVSMTIVDSAYLNAVQQQFNAAVSSGRLSQTQANQIYSQQQDVANGQFPLLQLFGGANGTPTP